MFSSFLFLFFYRAFILFHYSKSKYLTYLHEAYTAKIKIYAIKSSGFMMARECSNRIPNKGTSTQLPTLALTPPARATYFANRTIKFLTMKKRTNQNSPGAKPLQFYANLKTCDCKTQNSIRISSKNSNAQSRPKIPLAPCAPTD